MAKGLEETLREMLTDPGAAAAQADMAQAAALARQELSFRQRAGAAAARLRRAREDGVDAKEIAALEAEVGKRTRRLEAAGCQAGAANLKRPQPDPALAQVFGRAEGKVEAPPLTLAALSKAGEVMARAVANEAGVFHLTHAGDLDKITLQLSDAAGRVLNRGTDPVGVAAGTVLYLDVPLGAPRPEPGPVPAQPKMPDLTGQNEGVALALLQRIGTSKVKVVDKTAKGQPGIVIAQTPGAGTALTGGTKITLTVRRASGSAPAAKFLPGYIGGTLDAAEASLKELGLRHTIKLQVDDGPAGRVLAQAPAEGTRLAVVKSVELTVSQSRDTAPKIVTVPALLGKPRDLALELVKAADLKPQIAQAADPSAAAGVTAQEPGAGTAVKRGSVIKLTVNTPPEAGPARIIVPGLTGRGVQQAVRLLHELGLKSKIAEVTDAAPDGQVIAQVPQANARLDAGETVALTVSSGPGSGRARGDLDALVREMADDPRADAAGLTAARVAAMLRAGEVDSVDAVHALADGSPQGLRDRLKLRNLSAAKSFRAILRRALKTLG